MIDVIEAAKKAEEFVSQLYEGRVKNIVLEEFERSEDGRHWLVTIGYDLPHLSSDSPLGNSAARLYGTRPREYKVFKVRAEDGSLESMKLQSI